MLDQDNHIFLGDSGAFFTTALVGEKRGFDKETYDYAAPEQAQRPPTSAPILVPMTSPVTRPGTTRRATLSNGTGQPQSPSSGETSPVLTTSTLANPTYSSTSPPKQPPSKRNSLSRHDPQKSDIFSLGAIFLEILTFFMKRASRNFASHRSAKNKTPGRGGGLPDSSFHKNLGQIESWMGLLAKDATKKEDKLFRGVAPILALVERMLAPNPDERPTAKHVHDRLRTILTEFCGLGNQGTSPEGEPIASKGDLHCDARRVEETEVQVDFEELRIASQRAAAEACASVNPFSTEVRTIGLNGGIVYGIERSSTTSQSVFSGDSGGSAAMGSIVRGQDGVSFVTKSSSSSNDSRPKYSSSGFSSNRGQGKLKPKAKVWQAPAYAGKPTFFSHFSELSTNTSPQEISFG